MIQQTFTCGKKLRKMIIKITDEFIQFFYEDNYLMELNWIEEEIERRIESGEEELEEEELEPHEFYGFVKERWLVPQENFPSHMMEKLWFTEKMLDFINNNVNE